MSAVLALAGLGLWALGMILRSTESLSWDPTAAQVAGGRAGLVICAAACALWLSAAWIGDFS